jgi:hypothetical protein
MSSVNVDIPDPLRRQASDLAAREKISLDQFIATALAEKIAAIAAKEYLRARAARGSREKFDAVLSKIPDVEPEPFDRE